jgi:hypothetical protein
MVDVDICGYFNKLQKIMDIKLKINIVVQKCLLKLKWLLYEIQISQSVCLLDF